LVRWYRRGHRRFPWRETADPYAILVSEVMLQQTQAARVVPAYERFMVQFPTVGSLAAASLREVLTAWQGLGYPVRARRLQEAAAAIAEAGWPRTAAGLARLPGVGPYTAAAVASFAFGERIAALDTNARRVLSRWHGEPMAGSRLARIAADDLPSDAAEWNQAVMELGATLCRPRKPSCGACPVAAWCADPSVYVPPARQTPFRGSLRQVRGAVLRVVSAGPPATIDQVADATGYEPHRVAEAVDGLRRDGLVTVDPAGVIT
jgi:A/G-specific adenine glycosylase